MSLEDLDPDFQSDESDYDDEVGKKPAVVEDDDEDIYMELVRLHAQLTLFDHIYMNNIEIDMQHMEMEDWSSSDHHSGDSELDLIQDFVDSIFEDIISVDTPMSSPVSSPVTSHGDTSNPDTEDNALSFSPDSFHRSSSSSSDWFTISDDSDDDVDEQITDEDDANSLQDEGVDGQQ